MKCNPARARAVSRVLLPLFLFVGVSGATLAAEKIVLAVCDGTFSGASPAELVDKYRPVADVIGKALKAPVMISPVCDFKRLESGIKEDRFAREEVIPCGGAAARRSVAPEIAGVWHCTTSAWVLPWNRHTD